MLMWMDRNGLAHEVYAGQVQLQMQGCPSPPSVLGAVLVLKNASKMADRVTVKRYTGN
jgi:hypothetical protein